MREKYMSGQPDSASSVFVVHHDGNLHVVKSVASFPENPTSDEDKAAVQELNGILNGAQVASVDPATFNSTAIIFAGGR